MSTVDSLPARMFTESVTADMQLDPAISALADQAGAPADPIPWDMWHACTGISREHYFAAMASRLLIEGERLIAGYRAREDRINGVLHLAYSEAVRNPPKRETLMDRVQREVDAWGTRKAAV